MNNILAKIKAIKPKQAFDYTLQVAQDHTLTILIIFAGFLIGYALFNVNDLTSNITSQEAIESTNDPEISLQATIAIDEDIKSTLLALRADTDVDISSNIASYRRSAFSDVTAESDWVITAARLLENYRLVNGSYPTETGLIKALASQDSAFPVADSNNNVVNTDDSNYKYRTENCQDDGCGGFLLSDRINGSLYQLGETDTIKRDWVNDTALALAAFYKYEGRGFYPNEKEFTSAMSIFYSTVFEEEFMPTGPNEIEVNKEGSTYTYRGIDCDKQGCQSFVLRTTFKDGASYFHQNK